MNAIDAHMLKRAFLAGAARLEANKDRINELNVFPVPDGDTGTNMTLTIKAAAAAVEAAGPDMESLAKAMSSGSLRGARGNSGVILSQLLRGFAKEIKRSPSIDTAMLARAFQRASETAYKAVMKPKEGTILTVARKMAEQAVEIAGQTEDVLEFSGRVLKEGEETLSRTPDMLPVLREAGVVDAGGQGLLQFLHGAYDALRGVSRPEGAYQGAQGGGMGGPTVSAGPAGLSEVDIRFGYCTEFIVNLEQENQTDEAQERVEGELKGYLGSIGDSLVVVADDGLIKVHVHTNDPGLAIQRGLSYGSLSRMKIDNMREEHNERFAGLASKTGSPGTTGAPDAVPDGANSRPVRYEGPMDSDAFSKEAADSAAETPAKECGFVAVSAGPGLSEIFCGLGADEVIEGGQTMNPSTEDLYQAVLRIPAHTVFLLPNNKNIILAAEQVRYLAEDKEIIVIPSRTVPQGISALVNYNVGLSPEENARQMVQEMRRVKTGQVTYAVRDTVIDGHEIHEHDIMGLSDQGIAAVGASVDATALDTLRAIVDGESELITIYYGCGVEAEDAERFAGKAREAFPSCELELYDGGQPIYYYLLSVE